ncbi:MAG: hypothetical protein M1839_009365 [Geoglossum umbratile]|nr:MAG: hypothetical protein M1839_009365 [Geoglossum umbratile]
MSAYSSSGNWSSPQTIVKAKAGTPIAATSINHTLVGWGDQDVQVQLYYLTDHDVIQAWDLVRSNSANGSLSPLGYKADPNSSLVSYWPSLVLQDDKGNLEEIFFSVNPPAHWGNQSFDARGLVGSDLVELPTTTNYSALSVFYQRDDGKLAEWGWAQEPTIGPIPPRAPLGGLAVARSGSAKSEIYILWQDATGDIQVYWTNDQTGWKGPSSFPALRAADNGTAIACLTPSTWYDVPMSQDPRLSRCYFQVGGVLREVALSGSDWKIVGNVPMS